MSTRAAGNLTLALDSVDVCSAGPELAFGWDDRFGHTTSWGTNVKITQSESLFSSLFVRKPGWLPVLHGAALGGLIAIGAWGSAAQASPVVSSAANLVVPATTAGLYVNVVTGVSNTSPSLVTGWDINPFSSTGLSFFNPAAPSGGVYLGASGAFSQLIGAAVGAAGSYSSGATGFALNATSYFGFRFLNEADALVHYGWGSMIVGSTIGTRSIGQLVYESVAGQSILVGDTGGTGGSVPEPSTAALVLASAVAGALALRRRRPLQG